MRRPEVLAGDAQSRRGRPARPGDLARDDTGRRVFAGVASDGRTAESLSEAGPVDMSGDTS
jgi:hypothetical protein